MVSFGPFLNRGARIGRSGDEVFDLVLEAAEAMPRFMDGPSAGGADLKPAAPASR